jgi:hypothetical protein
MGKCFPMGAIIKGEQKFSKLGFSIISPKNSPTTTTCILLKPRFLA